MLLLPGFIGMVVVETREIKARPRSRVLRSPREDHSVLAIPQLLGKIREDTKLEFQFLRNPGALELKNPEFSMHVEEIPLIWRHCCAISALTNKDSLP